MIDLAQFNDFLPFHNENMILNSLVVILVFKHGIGRSYTKTMVKIELYFHFFEIKNI